MRSDQMVHAMPPHKIGLRAPITSRDQAPLLRMRTDVANCNNADSDALGPM